MRSTPTAPRRPPACRVAPAYRHRQLCVLMLCRPHATSTQHSPATSLHQALMAPSLPAAGTALPLTSVSSMHSSLLHHTPIAGRQRHRTGLPPCRSAPSTSSCRTTRRRRPRRLLPAQIRRVLGLATLPRRGDPVGAVPDPLPHTGEAATSHPTRSAPPPTSRRSFAGSFPLPPPSQSGSRFLAAARRRDRWRGWRREQLGFHPQATRMRVTRGLLD